VGGLFVKKVESVGVFGKKVDLSSTQSALCTVSVFFCIAIASELCRCHANTTRRALYAAACAKSNELQMMMILLVWQPIGWISYKQSTV